MLASKKGKHSPMGFSTIAGTAAFLRSTAYNKRHKRKVPGYIGHHVLHVCLIRYIFGHAFVMYAPIAIVRLVAPCCPAREGDLEAPVVGG